MEILTGKENLIGLIDLKIHHLLSLKYKYWSDDEISKFRKSELEDKVDELADIMNEYTIQCGIIMICGSILVGIAIFAISFAISKNIILSLVMSIVSLCAIWIFMKKRSSENVGSDFIRSDIEYDELVEVDTVKNHYDFWDSTAPIVIESLTDVIKVNPLMRPFRNTIIATQNYVLFKTRYYDNMIRIMNFYEEVFDDIWFRNKDVSAEDFVEYFVKKTAAWSCRKETYQMIMFNCTELAFTHLFLSVKGFDMSKYKDKDNDIWLYIDEFMRCIKENEISIDKLELIDKILTFVLDIDDYCQKKLDNINAI